MNFKKLLAGTMAATMLLSVGLAGCSNPGSDNASSAAGDQSQTQSQEPSNETVNLIYYTIGDPDNDLANVNTALNELLKEKINVTIQYNKIAWGDYGTKISSLVNSGSAFDVAFATGPDQGDYVGNSRKGAWLPLDDYLKEGAIGADMGKAINPVLLEGVKIDGVTYGIPSNKEVAVPDWWMYPKELVDKYKINIKDYKTLESLEPLLKNIKENETDWLPMELNKNAHNYFAIDGYEWVIDRTCPLMVKSDDKDLKIVNIFETDLAKSTLETLHKYYEAGYINEDAAVSDVENLVKDKKTFWKCAGGGVGAETSWSNDRGYDVVANQVTPSVVTTESSRGGIMCVNKLTKNPDAAVKFLNALNTDAEVRNMMNYGVEGKNYNLVDGQVEVIPDTYAGVQYTQGNWFILKTRVGQDKDLWDQFQAFNSEAKKSEALGFTPDKTKIDNQLAAIATVVGKYYAGLMTGTTDPATELPKFQQELKDAGVDTVMEELQNQITAWKAAQK